MALQGYDSKARTSVGESPSLIAPAMEEAARTQSTLSNRLSQFSDTQFNKYQEGVVDKAKKDALNDSLKGKPYHSESIYTAYGKAYNNTLSATYAANADLMISKKSTEFASKFENDPLGYSKAMESYIGSMTSQAPSPELETVITLSGEKVKNNTFGVLQSRENTRLKASKLETFAEVWDLSLSRVINLTASGDNKAADVETTKSMEHMKSMIDEGILTEANAQKMVRESKFQITYGVSQETMTALLGEPDLKNATEYLKENTKENRLDMSVRQNNIHQAQLLKMYNGEVKRRKAATTTNKALATAKLNKFTEMLENGQIPKNVTELTATYQQAGDVAKYNYDIQKEVQKSMKKFGNMSLPQIESIVRNTPTPTTIVEAAKLKHLKQEVKRQRTAYNDDPVGTAMKRGNIPSAKMGPEQGIAGVISGLEQATSNSSIIQSIAGPTATDVMPKQDAKDWSAVLEDPTTSIDEKINFISAANTATPDIRNRLFRQLNKSGAPIFSMAANLVNEGKPDVAKNVLTGQMILKEFGNIEGLQEVKIKLFDELGDAMTYASPGDREMLQESALALYMQKAEATGNLEKGLRSKDTKSVITDLTNGISKHNKGSYFLPKGVDKDTMEDWVDDLKPEQFTNVGGHTPQEAVDIVQRGNLISVGNGKYRVKFGKGWLTNKAGKPFVLEY